MEANIFGLNKVALIVDDDEDLRDTLIYDFLKIGFKVFSSGDGNEAFEVLKKEKVDLILSDIQMPKCDGICFLKKIKNFSMPINTFFFMSGYSQYTQEEVQALGAEALIPKPIDRKEMFRMIEGALIKA